MCGGERRDLEIVLDVDGQRIDDRAVGARCWRVHALTASRSGAGHAEPAVEIGGDPLRRVAIPELRDAAALAAVAQDRVDALRARAAHRGRRACWCPAPP